MSYAIPDSSGADVVKFHIRDIEKGGADCWIRLLFTAFENILDIITAFYA